MQHHSPTIHQISAKWKGGQTESLHLSLDVRTFGPCRRETKWTHTGSSVFTLLLQQVTGKLLLCNVPSDLPSSSLHSALSSADALISCSVFCLCSAGIGNSLLELSVFVSFCFFHSCCERLRCWTYFEAADAGFWNVIHISQHVFKVTTN